MGLFKKKKRKVRTKIIEMRMPVLVRQVIYDSIYDASEAIAEKLGLPPISEEVSSMESRASEDRLSKFSPLIPFIEAHSDISARVSASAYQLEMLENNPEDGPFIEEDLEHIIGLFKIVSLSAAVSVISTLMSLELLDTPVKVEEDE
jgi:hypothetical protein